MLGISGKVFIPAHLDDSLSSLWFPFSSFLPSFFLFLFSVGCLSFNLRAKASYNFYRKKTRKVQESPQDLGVMAKLSLHCSSPRKPSWKLQGQGQRPEGEGLQGQGRGEGENGGQFTSLKGPEGVQERAHMESQRIEVTDSAQHPHVPNTDPQAKQGASRNSKHPVLWAQ